MSSRKTTGKNVFEQSFDRLYELYTEGHRLVYSFSAGKDSGVCLELGIMAAQAAGKLPIDVVMRDEEIMFPGTFEYAERIAARPEVNFHWLIANQPIINVFNRPSPYWWTFDPMLDPEQWVRQPPAIAYKIAQQNIEYMTIPERFPPDEGKRLFAVLGLRATESRARLMSVFSAGGHITKPNRFGVSNMRAIYDWKDDDVWLAFKQFKWDYNEAYDTMHKMGVSKNRLRIAPPTMSAASVESLGMASRAWPRWFDRVAKRLPGVRTAAQFGKRSVQPIRGLGETWEQVFKRESLGPKAPKWIQERAEWAMNRVLNYHTNHSAGPLPDSVECRMCEGMTRSWKNLALQLYNGDPFAQKMVYLKPVEPEFFREGAGTWGGKPTF